jgi:ABC-type lipoprotein release transport system permease subunit
MIIPKLALRNLLGAGLRTWLNVIVLSFAFVTIVWTQGLLQGMNDQAASAMIETEIGGGQFWHKNYDPYDPLTLQDAHGKLSKEIATRVEQQQATPVLIVQGTSYPNGRIRPVLLKGIDPDQKILALPAHFLRENDTAIPALIGQRMAKSAALKIGDYVTIQWRDANGTFDATDIVISQIMTTSVQTVDMNQYWLPLKKLQEMTGLFDEATVVTVAPNTLISETSPDWIFRDLDFLLKDIREMIKTKSVSSTIIYFLLLLLAMLAIFDTQVLSIFKRRKEMGTLMALGLTRMKVIQLFTLEGALHGVLAALVGAIYGIPLLSKLAREGWQLPDSTDGYGFAIGERLYPVYSLGLLVLTTLVVLIVTTIVSYLPTRRIAHLKPTDALRGKLT